MKLRVLGAFGGEGLGHRPTAFLINDRTLIDAGTVASVLTAPEQLSIDHALISHSHPDHVAGLVYLSETLGFCETGAAVTVTGIDPVVSTLRWSVFNNTLWPDFSKIPHADVPVVKYPALVEDVEQRVADLWVTPVQVNHTGRRRGSSSTTDRRASSTLATRARRSRSGAPPAASTVSEPVDAHVARRGPLAAHRKRAADLDLVEVPRALEHAERGLPGDARAARHRRLGE